MPTQKPKILPHNLEAEQSVLGCVFLSTDSQIGIFDNLKPEDFYTNAHKKIFSAMLDDYRKNIPIDYITVTRALEQDGNLDEVGGVDYIVSLTNIVPSAANSMHYVQIVKNDSTLRKLIEISQMVITEAFESQSAEDSLQKAQKEIMDISASEQHSSLVHMGEAINTVISRMEKLSVDKNAFRGLKTGFPRLDGVTKGFQRGDLILLAARPSVGKSALALNMCNNAAMNGATVAIFSLEMPASQIAARAIASIGYVPMEQVQTGDTNANGWDCVFETRDKINKAKIYVDDSSLTTAADILNKCRRLKRENGGKLDLIMIDYLQLMTNPKTRASDSRANEVAEISRALKIAAKELDVPILALSQVSREVDKRDNKNSLMLSDLRESGAIEQDADIVMFLSRKEPKPDDIQAYADTDCLLDIAKHRNGALAKIDLKWAGQFVRFYEAETPAPEPIVAKTGDDVEMKKVNDASLDEAF